MLLSHPSPELDAESSEAFVLMQLSAVVVAVLVNLVPLFIILFVII